MKKYNILIASLLGMFALVSCMDSNDEPNTENFLVTSPTPIGEPNTTIGAIKAKYCVSSEGSDYARTTSNWYTKVNEDLIGEIAADNLTGCPPAITPVIAGERIDKNIVDIMNFYGVEEIGVIK